MVGATLTVGVVVVVVVVVEVVDWLGFFGLGRGLIVAAVEVARVVVVTFVALAVVVVVAEVELRTQMNWPPTGRQTSRTP